MRAVALAVVFTTAVPAFAQDADPPLAERAEPAPPLVKAEPDIIPVLKGKKAPYTGLLVPEGRFSELLQAELELDSANRKLQVQIRFTDSLESMYKTKLQEAAAEPAFYEAPSFNRWLGFTIGIVVTGLVVWGGVEIVKATGNGT